MGTYDVIRPAFYEGKANKLYEVANEPQLLVIQRKDDASANDGERKGSILGKGVCNNYISNYLFKLLEKRGIATHYFEELSEDETLILRTEPIKLEVIIRNIATGSLCKNLPFTDGTDLGCTIYELHLKDDSRHDPLINDYQAVALGLASFDELERIETMTFEINSALQDAFADIGIILVDFKVEFGRLPDGKIALIDEVSPDTCRLWDAETRKKLDKDRFRQNLGEEAEAYREIYERIKAIDD